MLLLCQGGIGRQASYRRLDRSSDLRDLRRFWQWQQVVLSQIEDEDDEHNNSRHDLERTDRCAVSRSTEAEANFEGGEISEKDGNAKPQR